MSNALHTIEIACNVIMTISIVSILFFLAMLGFRAGDPNANGISNYLLGRRWNNYDDKVIDGETVKYLVAEYNGNALIKIYTKTTPGGFVDVDNLTDKDSPFYVDPKDFFVCTALTSTNNELMGFTIVEFGVPLDHIVRDDNKLRRQIAMYKKGIDAFGKIISDNEREYLVNSMRIDPDASDLGTNLDTLAAYKQYIHESELAKFYREWWQRID